jgi:hypothetical protein
MLLEPLLVSAKWRHLNIALTLELVALLLGHQANYELSCCAPLRSARSFLCILERSRPRRTRSILGQRLAGDAKTSSACMRVADDKFMRCSTEHNEQILRGLSNYCDPMLLYLTHSSWISTTRRAKIKGSLQYNSTACINRDAATLKDFGTSCGCPVGRRVPNARAHLGRGDLSTRKINASTLAISFVERGLRSVEQERLAVRLAVLS